MSRKLFQRLIPILVFCVSGQSHGDEDYCPFELGNHTFNQVECSDGNCHLDINFPKAKGLKLHRVELSFGAEENYIRSQLEYEELEKSYSSIVYFSTKHSPFRIEAIYHRQTCFSLVILKIKNRTVVDITNET